jgi:hypothetical protein
MNIIEMAREAGFEIDCASLEWHRRIERFARLHREQVLEEAAGLCDVGTRYEDWELLGGAEGKELCNALAAAIRALAKEKT